MKPRSSSSIPARSHARSSVFGLRPTATSRCEPVSRSPPSRLSSMPPSMCLTPAARVSSRSELPSARNTSSSDADTSTSCVASRCSARSTIVTSAPKRRNACPNSQPMKPPPSTSRCAGTSRTFITLSLSSHDTSASPGMRGMTARVPTLMTMVAAVCCSPSTSIVRSPAKRPCPFSSFRPAPAFVSRRSTLCRHCSTFASLRRTTASMSTRTSGTCTPSLPAVRATCAARALATIVFVGVQPEFTHVPPTCARSTTSTRFPACASRAASGEPVCPAPTTITSHDVMNRSDPRVETAPPLCTPIGTSLQNAGRARQYSGRNAPVYQGRLAITGIEKLSGLLTLGNSARALVLVLGLLGAAASRAAAQDDHAQRPTVRVVRTERAIDIDGSLDEAVWRSPAAATEFTQRDPLEGRPASQPTEVWIAYDDDAIYIAARLRDSGGVSTRLGRRDSDLPGSDWITVSFDSYHDHRSAFLFGVNPSGVRRDERVLSDGEEDDSWDPVWDAATQVDETGWTAEMRIPLSQLRFPEAGAEQTWGVQIVREISRNNEEVWFAFTPKRERSGVARYAHLVGMQALRPRGPLELVPYGLTRALYRNVPRDADATFDNPFSDGSDLSGSAGLDLKYRLASNLTLDATFNPDFGQVEADPAEINLTAFETRFDERRPFFIEGSDVFSFGGGGEFGGGAQLFYSRRIGAPPPGRLPPGTLYGDMPEQSTILGAAKLTGKIGAWSLGVLEAVTAREHADYVTEDVNRGEVIVATPTSYFVGRARREFRDGASIVGGLVTALHRSDEAAAIAQRVRTSAYSGGIDFNHEWADRSWSLEGYVTAAHIRGLPAVITAAQRSSTRYFQRPDADHLELDSTAVSLSGWSGSLELGKQAGEHWRGEASVSSTSPGYETNDLGFQSRADEHDARISIEYVDEQPGRIFREWAVDVSTSASWNYGGDRLGSRIELEGDGVLHNYWSADFELSRSFGGLDDRLTRGGPLA